MSKLRLIFLTFVCCLAASAQTAATFGASIKAPGTLLDLVLDETRQRLYLVNNANNRIEVFSIPDQTLLTPIAVGSQPISAAMSPDGQYLYVTNFGSSSLSVIDLSQGAVTATVSLAAPPEGVAVGFDGRVLITTLGTGTATNPQNTLLLFDRLQTGPAQITAVTVPPPPSQNPTLPGFIAARPFLTFRGRLQSTADGRFIVGMNTPTGNSTVVFVYEAASGSVLRSRLTPGLSSVMSVSPDGARFMSGLNLFETASLDLLATTSASNAPFPIPGTFNASQNVGGSVFSPDGTTLYSAFNVAPFALPQPRPNSALLLLSNPRNLGITLGLRLPENVLGKMVISADGGTVYALSDSGVLTLPVGKIFDQPILLPESTVVELSMNPCNPGLVSATVKVSNAGKGKLTFTFQPPAQATGLLTQIASGVAPSSIQFTMDPSLTTRQPGTTVTTIDLASPEAINIPPRIFVYQNLQSTGQRGEIIPMQTGLDSTRGLVDVQVDDLRGRVYLANSGMNRIEVYDFRNRMLLPPINAGQFPRSMAMTSDGSLLYVANSGGEWISIVDLNLGQEIGKVDFPPWPFNFNQTPATPLSIAMGIVGPQFVASTGTIWSVSNNIAVPRPTIPVINSTGAATVSVPAGMVSSPGHEAIILMNNAGAAYRYDSLSDSYVNSQTVMSAPINSFYGPLAAGPGGQYFVANRAVLNSALAATGGLTAGITGGSVTQGVRDEAAVAAVSNTVYARFTTPSRQNATSTPVGDPRPLVELVDLSTQASLALVAAPEGPPASVVGAGRANVTPRMMATDSTGSQAFLITTSGLSVVSLAQASSANPPAINANGVVNAASYSITIAPGSLISIFGQNLASNAAASSLPLPTVLGGSCVTFNALTLPLLAASATQINAQLPPNALPGTNAVVVHSAVTGLKSNPLLVNVSTNAPAVFSVNGQATVFHGADYSLVTPSNPGRRGEVLVLFGTGIPAANPALLDPGAPAPLSPLVTTVTPQVFIGNPDLSGTQMKILWSGFTPGFVGLNQINLSVPANAVTGDNLPVVVGVGSAQSPRTGPLTPVSSIR